MTEKRILRGLLALALLALLGVLPAQAAGLEGLKIGVVDINSALNRSSAGARSKNILLSSKTQLENELKAKEEELKEMREDLQNNLMLTEAARKEKEDELRKRQQSLRREVQAAQRELQAKERKLTESIFIELRTVIAELAREKAYDLVLEQNASQVVLYSSAKFDNLTDEVIQRYDKYQAGN